MTSPAAGAFLNSLLMWQKSSCWQLPLNYAADYFVIYAASKESHEPEGLFIHSDQVLFLGQNTIFKRKNNFKKLHFNT